MKFFCKLARVVLMPRCRLSCCWQIWIYPFGENLSCRYSFHPEVTAIFTRFYSLPEKVQIVCSFVQNKEKKIHVFDLQFNGKSTEKNRSVYAWSIRIEENLPPSPSSPQVFAQSLQESGTIFCWSEDGPLAPSSIPGAAGGSWGPVRKSAKRFSAGFADSASRFRRHAELLLKLPVSSSLGWPPSEEVIPARCLKFAPSGSDVGGPALGESAAWDERPWLSPHSFFLSQCGLARL